MTAAILFDLDGLLADSETLHCQAWQTTLAAHGLAITTAFYCDWWVRRGLGITKFIQARNPALDVALLRRQKAAEYAHLVATRCQPMPGAIELLDHLAAGRWPLALASSAWSDAVQAVLTKLAIADRFAAIVTGNDVPRAKPHPDIFLLAAARLGAAPARCVVLEDAEKGVLAAQAAGMKCIAVPTSFTADNDFSHADLVVPSLCELTVPQIDALLDRDPRAAAGVLTPTDPLKF
jgi:HAD superfamily hydrolase (TIGR01509 family)